MHRLVKTSAMALVLCGFAGNFAARAANCLPEQDDDALHVASVEQQLVVASSACREITARYGQFTQRFQSDIQDTDATLLNFFTQHNPQSGAADLKTFRAKLAYIASMHYAREPMAFCQQTTQMLIDALGGRATLGRFAATQPVEFEMPYIACETKPASGTTTASVHAPTTAPPASHPVVVATVREAVRPEIASSQAPAKPAPQIANLAMPPQVPARPAEAAKSAPPVAPHLAAAKPAGEIAHTLMPANRPVLVASMPKAATHAVVVSQATPMEATANLTVEAPIIPMIKPPIPEMAAPRARAEVQPLSVALVQPPVLPKVKPLAPVDTPIAVARTEQPAPDRKIEAKHHHVRIAVQPPILPTAKPFIRPAPPVAVARARSSRGLTHVAAAQRHDRRAMVSAEKNPIRIARDDIPARSDRSGDRRLSALRRQKSSPAAQIRLATARPELRTKDAPRRDSRTAARASTGAALAEIDNILARLTAPVVTPAAAHPASVVPASVKGDVAAGYKFGAQPVARPQQDVSDSYRPPAASGGSGDSSGSGNGNYSAGRNWTDEQPPRRNGPPPWANANRNSTYAQNDDDYASLDDEDRGPPARARARGWRRRTWDSYRAQDSDEGPRWDDQRDDGDQGDDDNGGGYAYGPPSRDEGGFRGAW